MMDGENWPPFLFHRTEWLCFCCGEKDCHCCAGYDTICVLCERCDNCCQCPDGPEHDPRVVVARWMCDICGRRVNTRTPLPPTGWEPHWTNGDDVMVLCDKCTPKDEEDVQE
jgi:hypothetical protein